MLLSRLPRVLRLALALGLGAVVVKILRVLAEIKRCHALLCALPALPADPKQETLTLGWGTSPFFRNGKPFTVQNVRTSYMSGLRRALQSRDELRREGVLNFWFMSTPVSRALPNTYNIVIVHGMEEVRTILAAKNQHLFEKGSSYEVAGPLIGKSVLSTRGDEWQRQRLALDHGFKDDIMARSMPLINETVQRLVDKLEPIAKEKRSVNVSEEALKLTMDVLGRFAFSYEFGSITAPTTADAPLYDAFNTLLWTLNLRCIVPPAHYARKLPLIPGNAAFDQAMKRLDGHVERIVGQRIAAKQARQQDEQHQQQAKKSGDASGESKDLLDVMLDADIEVLGTPNDMSTTQIVDNIKTMLFAGHDTTAAALAWCLYLLFTEDPKWRDGVRAEYEDVLGTEAEPTFEALQRMPLLDAVLTETLRLYPSAGFTRRTLEDVTLGKHVVPKGTDCVLFPYLSQRDPDCYERPNEFDPTRWTERLSKNGLPLKAQVAIMGREMAFLPFSLGVRNCVGRSLALNELKVALIKLLRRYDFEHVHTEDFQEDPIVCMTLMPPSIEMRPVLRST